MPAYVVVRVEVTDPERFKRYQQLAIQQNIAQENYMAAAMDQVVAMRWYGVWGANAIWW